MRKKSSFYIFVSIVLVTFAFAEKTKVIRKPAQDIGLILEKHVRAGELRRQDNVVRNAARIFGIYLKPDRFDPKFSTAHTAACFYFGQVLTYLDTAGKDSKKEYMNERVKKILTLSSPGADTDLCGKIGSTIKNFADVITEKSHKEVLDYLSDELIKNQAEVKSLNN